MKKEVAYFGAGCFWGVQHTFSLIEGVLESEVGYMGGNKERPSYKEVCMGTTGHAEVVRVVFDADRVSYRELLAVFWACHDPTQRNQQGPDIGSQYRSIILYTSEKQKGEAKLSRALQQKKLGAPKKIATEIVEAGEFYRAEEYHQAYVAKNGSGACHFYDSRRGRSDLS
jgi:peptide-methionine (S)-S-oxide reductase